MPPALTGRRQVASLLLVGGLAAAGKARRRLSLPPPVTMACWFLTPVAIAAGFERSRARDAALWTAQMLAYKNAFELPNDDPTRLRERTHIDYPIAVDKILGGGAPPGQRLQRALRRRGHLSLLDKALTFFYWTWEVEPHAVMAWIRWRHPERFAGAAGRLAAVFDLTLIGYWALPTAPPWWSSEEAGRMDGEVRRVMDEVARWVKGDENPTEGNHEIGENPFAAMPSDHFASATMTAILLREANDTLGALGGAYALLLGFTLVYLGEHYVSDLFSGLALALAVHAAGGPVSGAAERLLSLG